MWRSLGHTVTLFCLNTKKHWVATQEYTNIDLWAQFYSYPIHTNGIKQILKSLFSIAPFQLARFFSYNIEERMAEIVKKDKYDLIVYQGLAMTQYLRLEKLPKLYRVHNVESKIWHDLSLSNRTIWKSRMYSLVANSLAEYEKNQLSTIDIFSTLSNEEARYFERAYSHAKVETIAITLKNANQKNYQVSSEGILFIGSLDWQPNKDGLDWFLANVYPSLGDIPLTIAGKGNYSCDMKNITILRNYDSTEDLLSNHRLMIVPILSGAGIRIKILEAMKYGMPLISTRIGAEGIDFNLDTMIIEDDAAQWISQIQLAYHKPSLLSEMSQKAKTAFESNYSKEVIMDRWQKVISNI